MHKTIYTRQYEVLLTILREARAVAELTQAELAKRLGISQSDVSKCEMGTRRLDIIEVKLWAETLGVGFADLVRDLEEKTKADMVLTEGRRATSAKRKP